MNRLPFVDMLISFAIRLLFLHGTLQMTLRFVKKTNQQTPPQAIHFIKWV